MRFAAVIPAAGLSTRMRAEKILLPFGGSTVLETILGRLAALPVEETVVVLRETAAGAAEAARAAGSRVVWNPDPHSEMLQSIRLGLAALRCAPDAVFLWPGDHPAVEPDTLRSLVRAAGREIAVLPTYRSQRGHPALLGSALLPAVAAIGAGLGLRQLWRERGDAVRELPVEDPGVIRDLDTPEDYAAAAGPSDL